MKKTPTTASVINVLQSATRPIHMVTLARKLNTSQRQLRILIQDIRENNLLDSAFLIANEKGYFISKNKKEIDLWLLNYSRKAITMFRVVRSAKKHLHKKEQEKYQLMFQF